MIHIYTKDKIRDAVARAMLLDAEAGTEAAIEVVAEAFALPVEAVRDCISEEQPA